jgi:cell division transport system permease protein
MILKRSLKRSLSDFSRHPWLHLVSVATITVALLMVGVFLVCRTNLEQLADQTKNLTTGTVYLKENLEGAKVPQIREKILAIPGVKDVTFKSKAAVMEELQVFLNVSAPSGPQEIFPDILEVELKPQLSPQQMTDLKIMITQIAGVGEIDFSDEWISKFQKIRNILGWAGILLGFGVIVGSGFIIANFMGMRHQARKSEIEIVQLHGAQRAFVMTPFLVEGFFEGIIGALLSLIVLAVMTWLISAWISVQWSSLVGIKQLSYLSLPQMGLVLLMGIAMAFFGSVAVYLRFQNTH